MELAEGIQQQDSVPAGQAASSQDAGEKLLKQSEVNDLVGRIKHEAYSKGMRDAQGSLQSQSQGGNLGGMPQLTDEQVRQIISEEAQKQNHIQAAQSLLSNFGQQMTTGKGKYPDFDETVSNLGSLQNIPHVVQMATDTGIAGDVMYELGKNPSKVATLTTLSYVNPHLAKVEMDKLAQSIKMNESAAKAQQADEPLDQIKPSSVGTDNGSNAVRDLRRMSWARA